jgi:hypothetical protein
MPDETHDKKYSRQTGEQFEALGRFVQEFEQLVDAVRTTSMHLLSSNSPKQQQLVNVVLFHKSLTAQPLFEIMRGLYAVFIKEFPERVSADDLEVINAVMRYCATEFSKLAQVRNDLLHGTWFIGWANEKQEDFSELQVHKFRVTKEGYEPAELPKSATELSQLTNRCQELGKLIWRIFAAFYNPTGRSSVAANVRLENGRWLPEPPPAKAQEAHSV